MLAKGALEVADHVPRLVYELGEAVQVEDVVFVAPQLQDPVAVLVVNKAETALAAIRGVFSTHRLAPIFVGKVLNVSPQFLDFSHSLDFCFAHFALKKNEKSVKSPK